MHKPNSFSQIDELKMNKFDNQSQTSKKPDESSQRNLSVESDDSDKSAVMVPKLSKSDKNEVHIENNE